MIALDTNILVYAHRMDSTWNERAARVSGDQVHDARVAALCRLHGVRKLWTADRDFSRFGDLRIDNPLV